MNESKESKEAFRWFISFIVFTLVTFFIVSLACGCAHIHIVHNPVTM